MSQTHDADRRTDTDINRAKEVDRQADHRAAYLKRTTTLTDREADALAYAELGFSYRGVAKQIDSTEATVRQYLERAAATYGLDVAACQLHFGTDTDLEPVDRDTFEQWAEFEQEQWASIAARHPDRAPDWFPTAGES